MGLLSRSLERIAAWLASKTKEEFGIRPVTFGDTDAFVSRCIDAYRGEPDWIKPDGQIRTVNFARSICSETARLTTLAIGVSISGSQRGDWMQEQVNTRAFDLRHWVEFGCAYGTVILKPNGDGIDLFLPGEFRVTACESGVITGVVFQFQKHDTQQQRWFTRLEYHRFLDNGNYAVSNRCYASSSKVSSGRPVAIETTPWIGLQEDVEITGVERPLFGVFRTPGANPLDPVSPYGLPIFSDALEELKDLDVAYSRNAKEIWDSKRTVLIDADRLFPGNGKRYVHEAKMEAASMGLPDYVRAVEGMTGTTNGGNEIYHEINPTLETEKRLTGINALLSQIGYKCGFSNGYFVFNEQTGMVTATQVEADQQRTIQLIKDVRDQLESCLDGVIYALDKFADLYDLAPVGKYEVAYSFGDITYSYEEDRAAWQSYVSRGWVPKWLYFVKFEGMSEKEAKDMTAEADQANQENAPLFGVE